MIKLDIFSDTNKIEPTVFPWLRNNHPLEGKKTHLALISGSCQQHYAGFIKKQSLYQFDAPSDLLIYDDKDAMSLKELMVSLHEKILSKGSFYLNFDDCSFYIAEEELSKLSNQVLIQEKTDNPYALPSVLRSMYD